ncbi:MAG: paraquat-inducible protein A [Pseudomonadota bacterium]
MLGKLASLSLLGLLPVAIAAPLAVSEVSFLFVYEMREEISIYGSLIALYESGDMLLFSIILVLSVVGPYLRLLLMAFAAFARSSLALRMKPALDLVGRFSLIDVIIISLLVISFRVPEFKLQWGFYFVLCLWVLDMLASFSIWRRLRREERRAAMRETKGLTLGTDPIAPVDADAERGADAAGPARSGDARQGGAGEERRAVSPPSGAGAFGPGSAPRRAASARPDPSSARG